LNFEESKWNSLAPISYENSLVNSFGKLLFFIKLKKKVLIIFFDLGHNFWIFFSETFYVKYQNFYIF